MLILASSMKELSFRSLMAVYAEGNRENGLDKYPEEPEGRQLELAELDFYQYLREVFYPVRGAVYCVWQAEDTYVSALRLEPYRDGLLLEALETAPGERRKGYAEALIRAVLELCENTRIYSHVGKRNEPSLKVHEKCGFRRALEYAVYVDGSVNQNCCTLVHE